MTFLTQLTVTDILILSFTLTLARYLLIAGGAFALIWWLLARRISHRRIDPGRTPDGQILREIALSVLTIAIFLGPVTIITYAQRSGWGRLYFDPMERGLAYLLLTVPFLLLLHDTYFYWIHRAMHHPRLFGWIHRAHHLSRNPTPWAAFAFHPLEAVLQSVFMTGVALLIPTHIGAFLLFQVISLVLNVYGHLGYELEPAWLARGNRLAWMNTTRRHQDHHRLFTRNYGLYFTHWDRWMGTLGSDTGPTSR